MEVRRLYRSRESKILCGVCGGLAEYFHVDVTMVRLLWIICSFGFPGIFIYIAAALIMPKEY